MTKLTNAHISGASLWDTPEMVKAELPITSAMQNAVLRYRKTIGDIIVGRNERMLVVAGPCSIHEVDPVMQFAENFKELSREFPNAFFVMRACFEKPRTISRPTDWPGLIMDPDLQLDGSHDFNKGIRQARSIALALVKKGMPIAMEIMDPDVLQYLDDVVTFVWTGARNVLVPNNRRMGSGISMPIGFKNGLDGDPRSAIDAVQSASHPNFFFGIDAATGRKATFDGEGNDNAFVILRGGDQGPNYGQYTVARTLDDLTRRNLNAYILIDCSHGNSGKDPARQPDALQAAKNFKREGMRVGAMLEIYLMDGNQNIAPGMPGDRYNGLSITDKCMSWTDGAKAIRRALNAL